MPLPLKNLMKTKSSPPKNSIYCFFSIPKKNPQFCYLPKKNSICPQLGADGMDIKRNSPMILLS